MTAFRVQAKRTTGSGPPADLEFGEIAYSDEDQQLHVGRPAPASPTSFPSNLGLINESIADLTADLASLGANQTAQGNAIAALNTATDSQADAIGALYSSTNTLNGALLSLAAEVQTALDTKANDADLAVVSKTGAYSDLTGLPTLFSGAYADLSGKPTLFSGAYGDLTGRPTIPYGFTYDQVAEPTSPPIGSTWRERAANGSIVADWEWSGSLWLGQRQRSEVIGTDISGSGGRIYTPQYVPFSGSSQVFIEAIRVSFLLVSGTVNASNSWLVWARCYRDDATTSITFATQTMTTGTFDLVFPINSVLPVGTNSAFVGATMSIAQGTPGSGKFRVAVTRRLIRV